MLSLKPLKGEFIACFLQRHLTEFVVRKFENEILIYDLWAKLVFRPESRISVCYN
jgi:hypothetical protein